MTLRLLCFLLACVFLRMPVVLLFLFASLSEVARQCLHSYSPHNIHVSLIFLSPSLVDDKNLLFLFFSACFTLMLVCYAFFYFANRRQYEFVCFFVGRRKRTRTIRKLFDKCWTDKKHWTLGFVTIFKNNIEIDNPQLNICILMTQKLSGYFFEDWRPREGYFRFLWNFLIANRSICRQKCRPKLFVLSFSKMLCSK